jgi:hypothetical protein
VVNVRYSKICLSLDKVHTNVRLRIVGRIDNIGIFWAFHLKNCLWFQSLSHQMHLALSNFIFKILFQLFDMIFPLLDVSTFTYGFYNFTSNFYYDFFSSRCSIFIAHICNLTFNVCSYFSIGMFSTFTFINIPCTLVLKTTN